MKKIPTLSPEKRSELVRQLQICNVPEESINRILYTTWWELCTDIKELTAVIKARWGLELNNDIELFTYLFSPANTDITVVGNSGTTDIAFLVWVDTAYRSSGAEINTGDKFDSWEDFYNHLGESYRKCVSYDTFYSRWRLQYGHAGFALIIDDGYRTYMDFIINDETVTVAHIGDVDCGSDKEVAGVIEALDKRRNRGLSIT